MEHFKTAINSDDYSNLNDDNVRYLSNTPCNSLNEPSLSFLKNKKIYKTITNNMYDAQKDTINDLLLENKMLSEAVEKYKKLYYDLCSIHK